MNTVENITQNSVTMHDFFAYFVKVKSRKKPIK